MSHFYLLGFRGAGKTTVGEALAREHGRVFLDLDQEWEKRRGETIVSFTEREGIAAFREEEFRLLEEIAAWPGTLVVATGGGIVDSAASRDLLERLAGPKIFLRVPAEDLWDRLKNQPERRKIGGLSSPERLRELLRQREPHYEKIATYSVVNRDITQALTEIKQLLSE